MDDIVKQIRDLCAARNARIMAHNYVRPEVQEVADLFGDSYELARRSREIEADVLVVCGVRFMAETLKLLNPGKIVILPDMDAGCPMADMADADCVAEMRRRYPDAIFVCYVNTTARVKALSDVCCTSSNALAIVRSIPAGRPIVFLPDRNLGSWISSVTGRDMILWGGCCPSHNRILPEHVAAARRGHPAAVIMVHPECTSAVRDLADVVLGTSAMISWAAARGPGTYVVGTEEGLLYRLRRENPGSTFVGLEPAVHCANMKKITLAKILWALQDMSGVVEVPANVSEGALASLDRMLVLAAAGSGS